jgi:hypothetical protein
MEKKLQNQVNQLRIALFAVIALNVLFLLTAFDKKTSNKFEEIDVKRLNLVEEDGRLSMVIANKKRLPDAITNGQILKDSKGERGPGMLIYNEDGDECGGYTFGKWGAHFSMDQYKQDQAVYMQVINGNNGQPPRTAGFWVNPQAASLPIDIIVKKLDSINAISDKSEKEKVRTAFLQGLDKYNKAFMGRTRDDNTGLFLFDKDFKTRFRAYVDTSGNPKLELLDNKGKVIYSLPQ